MINDLVQPAAMIASHADEAATSGGKVRAYRSLSDSTMASVGKV